MAVLRGKRLRAAASLAAVTAARSIADAAIEELDLDQPGPRRRADRAEPWTACDNRSAAGSANCALGSLVKVALSRSAVNEPRLEPNSPNTDLVSPSSAGVSGRPEPCRIPNGAAAR